MIARPVLATALFTISLSSLAAAEAPAKPPAAAFPDSKVPDAPSPAAEPAPPVETAPAPAAQPAQPAAPQPMPSPPPPPPGYYYAYAPFPYYFTAAPPSERAPAKKSKSTVYLQVSLGPGLFRASNDRANQRHFTGGTVSAQIFLGARPSRIVALGAGFVHDQVFSLSARDDQPGQEPDLRHEAFTLDTLCFFTDWFVPQVDGLHFPAYVGFSVLTPHGAPQAPSSDPTLFYAGVGVGYDVDVGGHVRLGGAVRTSFASYTFRENTGTELTVFIPALLATASFGGSGKD